MTREQKIYILECSKKHKINITLIRLVFETVNSNICRFQWLENIFKHNFYSPIFHLENTKWYPNKPFPSWKYSRQRKYFWWKLNWFFCKTLHPWKVRRNHIITSCIKRKRNTTNSTNPYFSIVTLRRCLFSPFSSFNDEKNKLQGLQKANHNSWQC